MTVFLGRGVMRHGLQARDGGRGVGFILFLLRKDVGPHGGYLRVVGSVVDWCAINIES